MSYIANLLGYLLNFIYNLVQNYGKTTKNNEENIKNTRRI